MSAKILPAVTQALRLIRSGRLEEATSLLRGRSSNTPQHQVRIRPVIDLDRLRDYLPGVSPEHTRSRAPDVSPAPVEGDAQFVERQFSNQFGSRSYKLYIPSSGRSTPLALLVMLHGCTQNPDDFATGTRMNQLAEELGFLVAYPAQPQSANPNRCWNWFERLHLSPGMGEPSLIVGIVQQIMRDLPVDPARVYVGGLSAGGAAALNLASMHPELFAAVCVHSGLPYGAGRDLPSALAAMRQGATTYLPRQGRPVPTILFHGSQDGTVHPRNALQIVEQATSGRGYQALHERGEASGGRRFSKVRYTEGSGTVMVEHWIVQGGGHTWFGGDPAGSHTDPLGPDVSREMVRFFLEHRLSAAA